MNRRAYLVLEDDTVFEGQSFGAERDSYGELVFSTSMTGYQEALTDPSFAGQLVVLTYPLIGNYGINDEDNESVKVQVAGFVVREHCLTPSNGENASTLHQFLAAQDVPGIFGVDTRAVTTAAAEPGSDDGGHRVGLAGEGGEVVEFDAALRRRGPRGAGDDAGGVPVGGWERRREGRALW